MGSPNFCRFTNSWHFKFVLTVTDLLSTSSVLQLVFVTPVDNVFVNSEPLTSAHLKVGYSSKYRRAAYRRALVFHRGSTVTSRVETCMVLLCHEQPCTVPWPRRVRRAEPFKTGIEPCHSCTVPCMLAPSHVIELPSHFT